MYTCISHVPMYNLFYILLNRSGGLDWLNEETLDQLDRAVFDREAGDRVRIQALLFFMDHTQGFDQDTSSNSGDGVDQSGSGGEGVEGFSQESAASGGGSKAKKARNASTSGSKNKSSGKKDKESNEGRILQHQRSVALQLETFTELIEHHFPADDNEGDAGFVELFVTACLGTHKKGEYKHIIYLEYYFLCSVYVYAVIFMFNNIYALILLYIHRSSPRVAHDSISPA